MTPPFSESQKVVTLPLFPPPPPLLISDKSMSSLGVFSDECSSFLDMMHDIGIDKKTATLYNHENDKYSHCCRNRNWDSPDVMQFWFFFYFLILQSQAAFVNCLYVARFTIVNSKTKIKFPLLLLLLLLLLIFFHPRLFQVRTYLPCVQVATLLLFSISLEGSSYRESTVISKKTNVHVQHTFLYFFAVVLHDYNAVLYD